jgi:uridine kinase
MRTPFFVGISGGSGSGKTYFLKKLLSAFGPDELCLISQDNYYRPLAQQPVDGRGVENFDLPESIDEADYTRDLLQLRAGQPAQRLEYTFNNTTVVPAMLTFEPRPIVVVEGLFVFYFREIAKLLDLKIFVDASDVVKIRRRIIRDNLERGYDLDDVLYRYEHHVLPSFEKYISPTKSEVDFIIPNHYDHEGMEKALDVVVTYLRTKIPAA